MDLKFGYFYRSRGGAVYGPLIPATGVCSSTHPFADGRGTTWRPDGGYMLQECSSDIDLVQELGNTKCCHDERKVTAQQAAMIAARDVEISKLRDQCRRYADATVENTNSAALVYARTIERDEAHVRIKNLTEELARANSAISTARHTIGRYSERIAVLHDQVEATRNALGD